MAYGFESLQAHMTVKQLREQLEGWPDDMRIIIVADHGQCPMYLYQVDESHYIDHGNDIDVLHPDDAEGTEEIGLVLWA